MHDTPDQPTSSFPEVIDSTMLSDYLACPRKFHWGYIRKLQAAKPSIHLHFGGCFAAALDAARQAFYGHGLSLAHAEAAGVLELFHRWGNEELDAFPPKTFFTCVELLQYYLDVHPFGTDPIQPFRRADGMPATEFTFAIPLEILHPETGQPILYAGRFDLLGEYNGSLFVVDEKTTSQLGPTFMSQWSLRGQFIGYAWAAQQYGYPVAGAIVRGLCIRSTGFDHAEPIIYAPTWLIQEWYTHLHHQLQRLIMDWQEGYFDKNFDNACTHYGGCQFRQLCETNNPEPWVETHYQTRTWNPLHKGD
jgi:hypothetical protein